VPGEPSERFPCLVDARAVTASDQVWPTGIICIPLRKGFQHLVAVVDLFSRRVLSWKLSNSLDMEFCLEALGSSCIHSIFHSDQGCPFTSTDFVGRLYTERIRSSWSGRKRCYDNILVERPWRTDKYEDEYGRAHADGWDAAIGLARFLWRY
jgi:putative transposase